MHSQWVQQISTQDVQTTPETTGLGFYFYILNTQNEMQRRGSFGVSGGQIFPCSQTELWSVDADPWQLEKTFTLV